MIVEHEFLEQIAKYGWTLAQSVEFISHYKDPWPVLKGLYGDKCLEFRHTETGLLAGWRVEQILRSRDVSEGSDVHVNATDLGAKRAYE